MLWEGSAIKLLRLGLYTFSHFCVDFSCFYLLFFWYSSGTHSSQTVTLGFLAYNVIAFGFQPFIGYFCDTYRKIPAGVFGCLLLIAGLLFMPFPAGSIILIGLGNACFHIEGGIDSLRHSGGKMARSGVFVSSGALGVALGSLAGKSGSMSVYVPICILLLCLVLLCILYIKRAEPDCVIPAFTVAKPGLKPGTVILIASVSILIRSYAGLIIPLQWRTTAVLFVFPAIGAFLGKASGGFIADSIGAKKASVSSLLIAAVLLVFGYMDPWIYLAGILLFNISMSVTLCAIASVMPLNPGLAFGITTLALLCGNAPTFFAAARPAPLIFAALTVVSAACLYYILIGKVKPNEETYKKNKLHDV